MIVNELITKLGYQVDDSGARRYVDTFSKIKTTVRRLVAAIGIEETGRRILETAGAFEQARLQFTALMGSAQQANAMLGQIMALEEHSPFNRTELMGYARQLMAVGFSAGQITPILRNLSDISAGIGKEAMPAVIDSYMRMKETGLVTFRDVRTMMMSGIPIVSQLAKQFGVTNLEMDQMLKRNVIRFKDVDKAIAGMTSQGGKFYGLANQQSNTLFGIWKQIRSEFERIGTAIGMRVLPVVKTLLAGFKTFLERLQNQRGFQDALEKIAESFAWFGGFVFGVFEGLSDPNGKVHKAIAAVIDWIGDFINKNGGLPQLLKDIAIAIALWKGINVASNIVKTIKALAGLSELSGLAGGPVGMMIIALAAIAAGSAALAAWNEPNVPRSEGLVSHDALQNLGAKLTGKRLPGGPTAAEAKEHFAKQAEAAKAAGGGMTINFNGNVMNPDDVAKAVQDVLQRHMRQVNAANAPQGKQ